MGHEELETGKHFAKLAGYLFNPFHTRHHIKHLPTTIKFLADRTPHRLII
jgi:hypothetical protein